MKKIILSTLFITSMTIYSGHSAIIGQAIVDGDSEMVKEYLEINKPSVEELTTLIELAHYQVKTYKSDFGINHKKNSYSWRTFASGVGSITCLVRSAICYYHLHNARIERETVPMVIAEIRSRNYFPIPWITSQNQFSEADEQQILYYLDQQVNKHMYSTVAFILCGIGLAAATNYFLKNRDEELSTNYSNAVAIETLLRNYALDNQLP